MVPIENSPQTDPQAGARTAHSVLFVCTHNVMRSPLAECLFQNIVKESDPDWQSWKVGSAGTWVEASDRAIPVYQPVLAQRGIPYVPHAPRMITSAILQSHQLILTMEQGHKEALQVENPSDAGRIYLLSEMVGLNLSIPDPAKERRPDYEQLADLLEAWLRQGFVMIRDLAVERPDGK